MLKKKTVYHNMLNLLKRKMLKRELFKIFSPSSYKLACLIWLDMLRLIKMWRHVKGYPANGQTTYTNANNSKKNKTLVNFRLEQFYKLFGRKRRDIFPTLIQAEYNNRLWHDMWWEEWFQGQDFLLGLVHSKNELMPFDPVSLAKGQTNGYIRVGNASKIGKAKKITKQGTIGVPLFFTRYIYAERLPAEFPFRLSIADDLRRKMGKKKKQKKTK